MNSELQRDVELYVEISEKWKQDHEEVMASYNFEYLLEKGVNLFHLIVDSEERWRAQIYRGETEYSESASAQYTSLIRNWLTSCEGLLPNLKRFEDSGFFVKQAKKFRRCVREAEGILTPDGEFFCHDRLVDERDRAIDEIRESA